MVADTPSVYYSLSSTAVITALGYTPVNQAGDLGLTGSLTSTSTTGAINFNVLGTANNTGFFAELNGDLAAGPQVTYRRSRGTRAAPTALITSDNIGVFNFALRKTGGTTSNVGQFTVLTTETTPSDTACGTRFLMSLAALGSVTLTEIFRFEHATGFSMFGANPVINTQRAHVAATRTAAQIADKTNTINTSGKALGVQVYDTTNFRLMTAQGSTDVSTWKSDLGVVTVTPA